jgi:hypothetical protein
MDDYPKPEPVCQFKLFFSLFPSFDKQKKKQFKGVKSMTHIGVGGLVGQKIEGSSVRAPLPLFYCTQGLIWGGRQLGSNNN